MSSQQAAATAEEPQRLDTESASVQQERLAADLQHLRDLLEANKVAEARRFVKELEERWPEAERVQHYAHVLQPPKVRMRPDIPARSSEPDWKWLEEHAREYPGCWLAIYDGRLIAADPDRQVVRKKAAQELAGESYWLFHQPVRTRTP
jgi:hypothetical protein